jgi:hypothetical protein
MLINAFCARLYVSSSQTLAQNQLEYVIYVMVHRLKGLLLRFLSWALWARQKKHCSPLSIAVTVQNWWFMYTTNHNHGGGSIGGYGNNSSRGVATLSSGLELRSARLLARMQHDLDQLQASGGTATTYQTPPLGSPIGPPPSMAIPVIGGSSLFSGVRVPHLPTSNSSPFISRTTQPQPVAAVAASGGGGPSRIFAVVQPTSVSVPVVCSCCCVNPLALTYSSYRMSRIGSSTSSISRYTRTWSIVVSST